jgi:hypothetical protein
MRTATALMYVGAGLSILGAIVFFATTDQYADALAAASGVRDQALIDRTVDRAEGQELFRALVEVCLWMWMAVKNQQGRRWARVVATTFGVINVAGLIIGSVGLSSLDLGALLDYMLPQLVVGTASVVLGIVILIQLYRPESSEYYDDSTRHRAAMILRGYH